MGRTMPAHLTDNEAVRVADLNYARSFLLLAEHAVGGSFYEEPGLIAVITGPIPWLNVTVIHGRLPDPARAIGRVLEFYRQARAGFVMRIRVDFEMETQTAMRGLRLEPTDRLPGMVLNPAGDVPPAPADLVIADWDGETLLPYNEIMAASFGAPLELMNDLIGPGLIGGPLQGFVGYIDGQPVATSALFVTDGVAGVYNVATLPEYRRMGLGEAMTWHAVRKGLEAGCAIASLQASAMGQPVYARMGFRNIAPYETYILPQERAD